MFPHRENKTDQDIRRAVPIGLPYSYQTFSFRLFPTCSAQAGHYLLKVSLFQNKLARVLILLRFSTACSDHRACDLRESFRVNTAEVQYCCSTQWPCAGKP